MSPSSKALNHPNLTVLTNRSLLFLFTKIRDKTSTPADFQFYSNRLMNILAEETLGLIADVPIEIETPLSPFQGVTLSLETLCIISIIRAGDSLLDSFRSISPGVPMGKILIQRDETKADKPPVLYYSKLPKNMSGMKNIVLCDPMLATGGSAIKAIEVLLESNFNVTEDKIVFANVVSCNEGIQSVFERYPKVRIITCCVDEGLNKDKYIVPGLGDYGDRYFNT